MKYHIEYLQKLQEIKNLYELINSKDLEFKDFLTIIEYYFYPLFASEFYINDKAMFIHRLDRLIKDFKIYYTGGIDIHILKKQIGYYIFEKHPELLVLEKYRCL